MPDVYLRGSHSFVGPGGRYQLSTAYNIPEFDSLGHDTELLFKLMKRQQPGGRILIWGTGQGHVAAEAARASSHAELLIGDRDLLALRVTARNLAETRAARQVTLFSEPALGCLATRVVRASVDWMIVRSGPEPGSLWAEELAASAEHVLVRGGKLLVVSRSSSMTRLEKKLRNRFTQLLSVRNRGFRSDLLHLKH